jgi:hypothetical protein
MPRKTDKTCLRHLTKERSAMNSNPKTFSGWVIGVAMAVPAVFIGAVASDSDLAVKALEAGGKFGDKFNKEIVHLGAELFKAKYGGKS